MKRRLKVMAVLFMALVMCFGAAGCKKETGEEVPTGNVYVPAFSEISSDLEWIRSVMASGSKVTLLGEVYNRETYESSQKMITIDMATGEQTEKVVDFGEGQNMNTFISYKDGYIAVIYSYIEPTEEEIESGVYEDQSWYDIVRYDGDFNEISRISLKEMAEKIQQEGGYFYVEYLAADAEGNIYFSSDNMLYALDGEGNQICKIEFDNWINGIVTTSDGQVLVMYYNENYDMEFAPVDLAAKAMGEPLANLPVSRNSSGIYPAGDGKLYMNSDTKLYLYDIASQTCEEVLDWISCDINTNRLNGFAALEDGSFVAVSTTYDYSGEQTKMTIELATIKEVPASSVKQKKPITVAMMYLDYDIKEEIIKFNRGSDEYKISVKTYVNDDYSNYEDAQTLFNSDLASGNAADFFVVSSGGINVENLAAKGAIVDLKKFIEDDPDMKLEDFIPNIIDALSIDGKLYGIGYSFSVQTLVGKTADVGTGKSWTFKDVQELVKNHPDAKLMEYATKESMLQRLVVYSMGSFYDRATGECNFDSDDFVSVLELCNTFPEEYDYENDSHYVSLPTLLRSGKVLVTDVYVSDFDNVQLYTKLYGEPVNFIGYPTNKGSGSIANFNNMFCISSKSKNKDGAWAFIREYLLPEYQKSLEWELPINKEAFEAKITDAMTADSEDGVVSSWMYDDVEIEIGPLSEEEAQTIRDIVYGVDTMGSYDEQLFAIISEEAAYFFGGQKSAKDVAATIQSRAQLYIDENR